VVSPFAKRSVVVYSLTKIRGHRGLNLRNKIVIHEQIDKWSEFAFDNCDGHVPAEIAGELLENIEKEVGELNLTAQDQKDVILETILPSSRMVNASWSITRALFDRALAPWMKRIFMIQICIATLLILEVLKIVKLMDNGFQAVISGSLSSISFLAILGVILWYMRTSLAKAQSTGIVNNHDYGKTFIANANHVSLIGGHGLYCYNPQKFKPSFVRWSEIGAIRSNVTMKTIDIMDHDGNVVQFLKYPATKNRDWKDIQDLLRERLQSSI